MSEKVKVLYVGGTGRSGSTLVGNILGSLDGAISIGEGRHIWTRGLVENWLCGCGEPFRSCPFWTDVLHTAFGTLHPKNIPQLRASERYLLRLRTSPRWSWWVRHPASLPTAHTPYLQATQRLYKAIGTVSGARVIIDTSKTPTYAAMLSLLPAVDLRVLHLLRDPRATAYSWLHPKPSPDRGENEMMDRLGVAKGAFLWAWWNGMCSRLLDDRPDVRLLRMRYEAMVADPGSTLGEACVFLAPEIGREWDAPHKDALHVVPGHSVSGNPLRMMQGPAIIAADDRWQDDLGALREGMVLTIAGPKMRAFGYHRSPR